MPTVDLRQARSQPDILVRQAQNFGEQYFFDHLGDCMVLKPIIFVSLMQFAEVLYLFFVTLKSFSPIFQRLFGVYENSEALVGQEAKEPSRRRQEDSCKFFTTISEKLP